VPRSPEEWIKRFIKAAEQRRTTSEDLNDQGKYVDQMYLTGYIVECALKALVLSATPRSKRQPVLDEVTRGAASHDFERLKQVYERTGRQFPVDDVRILRRLVKHHWTTAMRYEVGKGDREAASAFPRDAIEFLEWVKRSL